MTRVSLSRIVADELANLRCLDPGERPQGSCLWDAAKRTVSKAPSFHSLNFTYRGVRSGPHMVQSLTMALT